MLHGSGRRAIGKVRPRQTGFSRRTLLLGGAAMAASGCSAAGAGGRARERLTPTLYYLGAAKVFALNPAGGAPITLVDQSPADGSRPAGVNDGIAIDGVNSRIYWSNMGAPDQRDGSIWRCELDGSAVTEVVARGLAHTPKQIRIHAGKLYWADREGMSVMRADLDGSGVETLVRTGDPASDRGRAEFWCVGLAIDPVTATIYWSQKGGDNALQGQIRRAPIAIPRRFNAASRRDIETLFTGLPEPIDLDLDLSRRQIYWTDRGDNTISRAPMDVQSGTDPLRRLDRQILVRGLREPIGLALDPRRERMAWATLSGEVGLASMDGSGQQVLLKDQGMLTGVAWVG